MIGSPKCKVANQCATHVVGLYFLAYICLHKIFKLSIYLPSFFFELGFNVETVDYKNVSFTVWDVGGQDKVRD